MGPVGVDGVVVEQGNAIIEGDGSLIAVAQGNRCGGVYRSLKNICLKELAVWANFWFLINNIADLTA